MAFGLEISSERAAALQIAIQEELTKRGYSPDADPVMAEYITIMIINNKTAEQISSELEDLIGSDFDRSFTEWLFAEASKGAPESPLPATAAIAPVPVPVPTPQPIPTSIPSEPSSRELPPHLPARPPNGPRIYTQALSHLTPTSQAQKRTASARSPSPLGPNKTRRTDLPTGPRAMARDGVSAPSTSRSLLDRVGGRSGPGPAGRNARMNDEIQARIDNITSNSHSPPLPIPDQQQQQAAAMMAAGGFPPGMDMNAMAAAAGMAANPLVLQEMMMNQMAMMAQMMGAMGVMNPGAMGGFGMQGMDGGMFNGMPQQQQQQQQQQVPQQQMQGGQRGKGGRGGMSGRGRRGGHSSSSNFTSAQIQEIPDDSTQPTGAPEQNGVPIVAPTPKPASTTPTTTTPSRTGFVPPDRPQSPTLCKFSLKCTNPLCRYSHPSPVATTESGVVLSNDPCEAGRECKDKDCVKGHVSPAVLNGTSLFYSLSAIPLYRTYADFDYDVPTAPDTIKPTTHFTPTPAQSQTHNQIPCRYGLNCTRQTSGCPYTHPSRPSHSQPSFPTQCRFGASCTRATCPFTHPEGRVLPTMFHKGLSSSAPLVNVSTPETGTMGGSGSQNRSVTFNVGGKGKAGGEKGEKEELERKMKELEERKREVEDAVAVKEAQAKKDENKPVPVGA
ncbi:hypothetical protein JAAARDRAFT_196086 [Jaapia argillacea MUCL 33604]|uniref:C3H1-type domain-containing protein n=1 Tax=Jaapia argillacea MUCL 33604 TaxID=933084 RepID=A0A067PK94_9AGAM|nr:hypothetical protein JAAARDRAFT_196086 [Jaapia argillacea MUCL 33604]